MVLFSCEQFIFHCQSRRIVKAWKFLRFSELNAESWRKMCKTVVAWKTKWYPRGHLSKSYMIKFDIFLRAFFNLNRFDMIVIDGQRCQFVFDTVHGFRIDGLTADVTNWHSLVLINFWGKVKVDPRLNSSVWVFELWFFAVERLQVHGLIADQGLVDGCFVFTGNVKIRLDKLKLALDSRRPPLKRTKSQNPRIRKLLELTAVIDKKRNSCRDHMFCTTSKPKTRCQLYSKVKRELNRVDHNAFSIESRTKRRRSSQVVHIYGSGEEKKERPGTTVAKQLSMQRYANPFVLRRCFIGGVCLT